MDMVETGDSYDRQAHFLRLKKRNVKTGKIS